MLCFFFFNDTATTEIYTLSLHDALPIYAAGRQISERAVPPGRRGSRGDVGAAAGGAARRRGLEEDKSELQSRQYLVCRLLLVKKKKKNNSTVENILNQPIILIS